jgi:hypothetical protein
MDGVAARLERESQELDLGALATAINAFDSDEFSGNGHLFFVTAERPAVESQSNRRDSAPQWRAC